EMLLRQKAELQGREEQDRAYLDGASDNHEYYQRLGQIREQESRRLQSGGNGLRRTIRYTFGVGGPSPGLAAFAYAAKLYITHPPPEGYLLGIGKRDKPEGSGGEESCPQALAPALCL